MLLFDGSKARTIREQVRLPLLNDGQIATLFHLLQQTIHKTGELAKCQIAIINRHAQSSVQWSCVQLKQYKQWLEKDRTWKLQPTPKADCQMLIKTRSVAEKILVCPVELTNQLGVLLEFPSLPWLETNQNYSQRRCKIRNWLRKLRKNRNYPKTLKTMWNGYKSGCFLIQPSFSEWGKTRNDATSFLELPTEFPESIRTNVNRMGNVQAAGLTDLENQMEQAEFASGHLINTKVAIDSLLLKGNSKMKVWKDLKLK